MQQLEAKVEHSKIEVNAKKLDTTETTVKASDGVIVYYQDSVIKASSAFYNKETQLLILDGHVEIIGYQGTKEHANHMEIHTGSKEVDFKQLFFVSENDVWLFSDKAHRSEGNYTLGRSILSSCDIADPLWTMAFERSLYDSEAKYMKVYDAKVYFMEIPVFYSPYLAFSTSKERTSGLLFPAFGYNSSEGFIYEQPVFWAISQDMDMEFNPQVRTSRGSGLYSTFRFVDSQYSFGEARAGYFRDSIAYQERENTKERDHYGLELNYQSSQVFSDSLSKDFRDGLYVNATLLSDIDYINLQKNKLMHFGLTPLQETRVNYFLHNEDYYTGMNAKYFMDTRKEDNDDTLQVLPSLQLHKYLTNVLWDNLTYNVDFHINNFDRKKGATLLQEELKVPLEFTTSFFDDFLNISLGEEFYYSKFFFGNGEYIHDDFEYYSNIHKAKLFTDLTKKYDGFIHVLQPSLEYIKPGNEQQSPLEFSSLSDEQKTLFTVGLPEEKYNLAVSHYFYDDNLNLYFYQRLTQKYYLNRDYKLADISNEMQYNWKQWQFYNNTTYAYEFDTIRDSSSRIALHKQDYYVGVGYSYVQVLSDMPTTIAANDINFLFGYTLNKKIRFDGAFTYDINNASSKQWKVGGSYRRDCWSIETYMQEAITPRPTGFTTDYSLMVQLNFIPFATIGTGEPQQ